MTIEALDYRTNKPISVHIKNGYIDNITAGKEQLDTSYYIAPGLVDLQINGFKGIDFNTIGLTIADLKTLTQILLQKGITTYYPTVISNSDIATESLLKVIAKACDNFTDVNACVGGMTMLDNMDGLHITGAPTCV